MSKLGDLIFIHKYQLTYFVYLVPLSAHTKNPYYYISSGLFELVFGLGFFIKGYLRNNPLEPSNNLVTRLEAGS